jgi:Beta-propeller repeat
LEEVTIWSMVWRPIVLVVLLTLPALTTSASGASPPLRGLPFSFEPNLGQTDPRVKFLARSRGMTVFLTSTETVLLTARCAVSMRLEGANPDPAVHGVDPLPGRNHSIIGRDPGRWRANVPTYARVRYSDVYRGVDLVYYGTAERQLEYDFVVGPGVDPGVIRLTFEGVDRLELGGHGDLVLHVGATHLRFGKPHVYQVSAEGRRSVAAAWTLENTTVGVRLGAYDTSKVLVIDPTVALATYIGGSGSDQAFAVALGTDGSVFLTGNTVSANFPTTLGSFQPMTGGGSDLFVARLNSTFTASLYSTFLGGSGDDAGRGIAVDPVGNAYVTGFTTSTDFPTTPGAVRPTRPVGEPAGVADAFVVKLNPQGSALVYGTYLGGTGSDVGLAIAIDLAGNAFVTGGTFSVDFPRTLGASQLLLGGDRDAFVTSLNSTGTALRYSTFLGGAGTDVGNAIAVDGAGSAYVTGSTTCAAAPCPTATDFPTTPGVFAPRRPPGEAAGVTDAFVTKLDAIGALVYSTYLGGTGADEGLGIVIDSSGHAIVTGGSASTDFPVTVGFGSLTGTLQAFLTRLNPAATAIVLSRPVPTSAPLPGPSMALGIAQDFFGRIYLAGSEIRGGAPQTDAFVMQLGAGGGSPTVEFFVGGTGDDFGFALAVDTAGNNVFLAGQTDSATGLATGGVVQPTLAGGVDGFVAKVGGFTPPSSNESGDSNGGDSKSGCVIVFAALGSPLTREVSALRAFRDDILIPNAAGRALVRTYYRLSPSIARVIEGHQTLGAITRIALRPVIIASKLVLVSPREAFALFAVMWSTLLALAVALALARRRVRAARWAFVATFIVALSLTLAAAMLDSGDDKQSRRTPRVAGPAHTARTDGRPAAPVPGMVRRQRAAEQRGVEHYEVSLQRFAEWPLPPGTVRVRPTFHPGGLGVEVESDLANGILTSDGFTVTEPKVAAAAGITGGDRIIAINGYPPAGGALASFLLLQRDPDRNTFNIQLDRSGIRMDRAIVVR